MTKSYKLVTNDVFGEALTIKNINMLANGKKLE